MLVSISATDWAHKTFSSNRSRISIWQVSLSWVLIQGKWITHEGKTKNLPTTGETTGQTTCETTGWNAFFKSNPPSATMETVQLQLIDYARVITQKGLGWGGHAAQLKSVRSNSQMLGPKNLAHEIIQIKEISMNEYHFDDPYYPPRTIVYQVWWSKALLRTKDWGPRAKSTLYVLICPIPHVVVSLPHFVFVRLHDFTKCVCVRVRRYVAQRKLLV